MKRIGLIILFLLIATHLYGQTNEDCMECHSDQELTTTVNDSVTVSLYVNYEQYESSIHGIFDCIECHGDIQEIPHDEKLAKVDCSACHDDVDKMYQESIHGMALKEGITLSANCSDCHGKHDISSSEEIGSHTNQRHLSETCGHCHSKPEVIALFGRRNFDPIENYKQSVHGKTLEAHPDTLVATCVSCHGSHDIYPPSNPKSSFTKFAIPNTCGKCHQKEKDDYTQSIHWASLMHGHYDSPVCNDCHGEHRIISPTEEAALTHPSLVSSNLCANCHANATMMKKAGLDAERFSSYMKTYHGLAVLKGSPNAANCVSCHEMHSTRSVRDPQSPVNPVNLRKTCSKCHVNPTTEFIQIQAHPINQKNRNPIAYYIKIVYIWIITISIAGMVLHNTVIMSYYIRRKWQVLQSMEQVQRFQRFEVFQHASLFLSFGLLVVTGFALKFPDAGWSRLLLFVGLTEELRSVLHRFGAVVMIIVSFIQLFYLFLNANGRKEIFALRPGLDDIKGFIDNMLFHLGLSKKHPHFGRFDYAEKFEYLALIWGVILMSATGFVLWFPEFFMKFFPGWAFEAVEVIHYFEAWLATLAILFWHWFFVIFHPEKYPISLTWLNGRISIDEQKHHHDLEKVTEEE